MLQHPPRAQPRPHGRVPSVRWRRRDHRGQGRVPDARPGQGALAALQHRGRGRRDPPSRGRLHPAGRRHPGDGAGRARRRRRDLPPDHGGRDRAQNLGRMAGQDRPGRHHVRARRLGHRQLRAPDRRHGRARRPGDPGRAPVHRDRAASGDRAAAQGRSARDGRAARERRLLVHARGGGRPAARAVRAGRALLLSWTARARMPSTSCSPRTSSA